MWNVSNYRVSASEVGKSNIVTAPHCRGGASCYSNRAHRSVATGDERVTLSNAESFQQGREIEQAWACKLYYRDVVRGSADLQSDVRAVFKIQEVTMALGDR